MKRIILTLLWVCAGMAMFATEPQKRNCGTMDRLQLMKAENPLLEQQMIVDEHKLQDFISKQANARTANSVVTIPVVVHVVYRTASQNISDAQIMSQIEVLNEDFARMNADSVDTPVAFQSAASATNFQFCLARRDPEGNPTTGIERRQTTVQSFGLDDDVKFYSTGGLDAWDVNKYFNIWVCRIDGGLLGYAEFPSSTPSNTYGVVIGYNYFGRVGVVSPPYNKGRTSTHEIGHCFRLYHIWGDDNGCTGTDYVNDTPNQGSETWGCGNFPETDACSPSSPGVMYTNYMDYSDDDCLNMFTFGQASRMAAALNVYYPGLLVSDGCEEVTTGIQDLSRFNFSVYPNPADNFINVQLHSETSGKEAMVEISDMLGKTISRSLIDPSKTSTIDLSSYNEGLYFVTVSDNNFKKTVRLTVVH